MTEYLKAKYNLENCEIVSVIDELSLWSAPFGLRLLDIICYKKGITALDIGFGLGFPLIELAMRLGRTSHIYGIDPWKAGIERTKQKIKLYELSNVEVIEGCAEQMPFESNYFDLIVSNNGINNVQDLEKTLKECNRVSKIGAQFVFTFNLDQTFIEFYEVYRQVLKENGLQEYLGKVSEHVYSKRKPVAEMETRLKESGFEIQSISEDIFHYRFSDGTSMLNHFFIKLAFLDSWKKIIPERNHKEVFKEIEEKLNTQANAEGGFSMQVPFVIFNCEKVDKIA